MSNMLPCILTHTIILLLFLFWFVFFLAVITPALTSVRLSSRFSAVCLSPILLEITGCSYLYIVTIIQSQPCLDRILFQSLLECFSCSFCFYAPDSNPATWIANCGDTFLIFNVAQGRLVFCMWFLTCHFFVFKTICIKTLPFILKCPSVPAVYF